MMTAISNKETQSMCPEIHYQRLSFCHIDIRLSQPLQTLREFQMLRIMESITDTQDWHKRAC